MNEPPYRLPAGCTYSGCGTQRTATLDGITGRRCAEYAPGRERIEQVDPAAAFRIARVWLAWRVDERFDAAAGRWAA